MTLKTGGAVEFKPRVLEGAPAQAAHHKAESLLLDGQQRLTSLYQMLMRDHVVQTITPRRQRVKRWFYLDIEKCLDETIDRDEAVVSVPEDRKFTSDFGRVVDLDISTREFKKGMFPLSAVVGWSDWNQARG